LFAHIGLKADSAPADQFAKAVGGIKNTLIGAIAGTLSLAGAVKAVNEAMGNATELKRFGDQTGANVEEMQKWRAVADQVSGSGAAVASSIDAIVSNQAKIKLGQGNISGYQLLGIDPRSDPFKVLEQIKAKTANLGAADRRNITGMFGVNADLISTLKLTNAQFDAMASKAYVISPSMIEGMNKARGSISVLKNEVSFYVAELATKLGPTIEKVAGFLEKFVKFIANGVMNIDKLIRSTIGLKAAIIAVAAVLAVMNAGFLTSPLGLFTIAILALMAVLDDLAAYSSGRGSLFGVIMMKMPALGKALQDTFGFLGDLLKTVKEIFSGNWDQVDKLTEKWGLFGLIIRGIVDAFRDLQALVESVMTGDFSKLWNQLSARDKGTTKLGDLFPSGTDAKGNKLSAGEWFEKLKSNFGAEWAKEMKAPLMAPAGGSTAQQFTFHIYGVQGPQQAFEEAGGRFMLDMKRIQAMKPAKR
jgi:hypothetical protein